MERGKKGERFLNGNFEICSNHEKKYNAEKVKNQLLLRKMFLMVDTSVSS